MALGSVVNQWLGTNAEQALLVVISAVAIYGAVLLYTRVSGLRSFAKFSAFDFAMTVAVGSLMAGVATSGTVRLANGLIALAVLYVLQFAVARARRASGRVARLVDNEPLLVLVDGEILGDAMASARVTEADLRAHVRLAGLPGLADAAAIVIETTGDVSVIARSQGPLDPALFEGVRGRERVR